MKSFKFIITTLLISLFLSVNKAESFSVEPIAEDSTKTEVKFTEEISAQLERILLHGLTSDVYGVVESSLFNTVEFKVAYPGFSSERVERQLKKIIAEGSSHSLRFKAYLTLSYLKNQDKFESPDALAGMIDVQDQNKIFYFLQSEIQGETVTVSN